MGHTGNVKTTELRWQSAPREKMATVAEGLGALCSAMMVIHHHHHHHHNHHHQEVRTTTIFPWLLAAER